MSRARARETFTMGDLEAAMEGVAARLRPSLIDEIPGAYKDIDQVMEHSRKLAKIEYTLKQIVNVKGRLKWKQLEWPDGILNLVGRMSLNGERRPDISDDFPGRCYLWACGAVGSALPWHGRGQGFESLQVHQIPPELRIPHKLYCVMDLPKKNCCKTDGNGVARFQSLE